MKRIIGFSAAVGLILAVLFTVTACSRDTSADAGAAEDKTYTTDVVIVGAGAAGLAAAVEAVEAGAQVIILEKLPFTGGSTARSGGKMLAAGSSIQKAKGISDNADDFYQFLMDMGEGHVDAAKLRLVADQSAEIIEWLIGLGAEFSDDLEPLHEDYGTTRGHFVVGGGGYTDGLGHKITIPMEQKAVAMGATLLLETPATDLVVDNDGTVTGVTAVDAAGSKITINAKSVVLATGGYDQNKELMNKYAPLAIGTYVGSSVGNVGDGLVMAKKAGAKIVSGGGSILLYLDLMTGAYEPAGLYVTPTGERFMDESAFWFDRTKQLIDRGHTGMFHIVDADSKTDAFGPLIEKGAILTADTPEALGAMLGMDSTLSATITQYNQMAAAGVDTDYGKDASLLEELATGPFFAIPFVGVTSGSFGGPVTDTKGRVLDTSDRPIAGLYAAGEVANGDLMWQEYPGSGASITMSVVMGRIAGEEAAQAALK